MGSRRLFVVVVASLNLRIIRCAARFTESMPRGQHTFNLPRREIILTRVICIIHVIVDRIWTAILGGNNTILLLLFLVVVGMVVVVVVVVAAAAAAAAAVVVVVVVVVAAIVVAVAVVAAVAVFVVVVAASLEITIITTSRSTVVTCIHIGRGASDCRISLWIGIVDEIARFLTTTLCIFLNGRKMIVSSPKPKQERSTK